jgi:hypothetical protein
MATTINNQFTTLGVDREKFLNTRELDEDPMEFQNSLSHPSPFDRTGGGMYAGSRALDSIDQQQPLKEASNEEEEDIQEELSRMHQESKEEEGEEEE